MLNIRYFRYIVLACTLTAVSQISLAKGQAVAHIQSVIAQNLQSWEQSYRYLHANPELSLQEQHTARYLASRMRELGFRVTESFGGYGLVAVLENGDGPVIMVRTDMDALPIREATGLSYASGVMAQDAQGDIVPVMHACGHDIHMAAWLGTATVLQELREHWQGTIIFIAQGAEEILQGAQMMLDAGLYTRFPRPDYVLALHTHTHLPAGAIGYNTGYISSTSDAIEMTVYGRDGHGAMPHETIDPIVLSARIILALQTIISREVDPLDSAVLTVGSIHGGRRGNTIPDEVTLQLTLRTFKPQVREAILAAIKRITAGVAQSAGLANADYPRIELASTGAPPIYNDPALTERVMQRIRPLLGEDNVELVPPGMGSEDFSYYADVDQSIPQFMYVLGTADPQHYQAYLTRGVKLPALHSASYRPLARPSIAIGVLTMALAVMELAQEDEEKNI